MATASTKRGRKKGRQTAGAARKAAGAVSPGEPPDDETGREISGRAWVYLSAAVLVVAAALRLYALEMKPLHHDEGVNGFFLTNLLREGRYSYDPANYHGPTLYYLTLPFVALAGLDTFVIRLVPSLFGVGTVWLVLALRRRVGAVAALAAAALVAVSPACVFYSRYFIHEMPFVFFTLGLVVAALRFHETGSATRLVLASAAAAMMFATKETAFISAGTLGLAWLTAWTWERVTGGRGGERAGAGAESAGGFARLRAGGPEAASAAVAGAAVLFVVIWVAFYSSFFRNWKGVFWDSFGAFAIWHKTGMSEFHGKPFLTYVEWLAKEDAAVLVLGWLGALIALFGRRRNRFALFAAAWGFGLLAAYSLISYKTPWLVLSFVAPLAIAGGYAVQESAVWAARRWRSVRLREAVWPAAAVMTGVALAPGLYQTYVVNFVEYDNDKYPYVYSQTQREFHDLVREIERAGERAGTKEPGFATASPDYWPLPWYMRDNPRAGFEGRLGASYDPRTTLAVVGKEEQSAQLQRTLGDAYARVGGLYPLRPGVNLVLYVRRDLAGGQ